MFKRLGIRKKAPGREGFTLVEAMVIVILVGLLVAMVGPPMFAYLQSHRLQTNTDRMVADLQLARSQAIARGSVLRVATTETGYTITDMSDGSLVMQHVFDDGVKLGMVQQANFFPWGVADNTNFNISNTKGAKQVNLLPTGIVEVVCP